MALPVLVVLGVVLASSREGQEEPTWRRPAPDLAALGAPTTPPTDAERAAFFFEIFRSRETVKLGQRSPAAWLLVGRGGLSRLGPAAADFLFDPARSPTYLRDPDLLYNTILALPKIPGAMDHDRLVPFLLHWARPESFEGSRVRPGLRRNLRRQIVALLTHRPDPRMLPLMVEEIEASHPGSDNRLIALSIFLRFGRDDLFLKYYPDMPPNEEEPDVPLKPFAIERIWELADPANDDDRKATARRLRPFLRNVLKDGGVNARIRAASALLRLGHAEMANVLVGFFREFRESEPVLALLAIERAARDAKHPVARDYFLKIVEEQKARGDQSNVFQAAFLTLAELWSDDDEVRKILVDVARDPANASAYVLTGLVKLDREQGLERIRKGLRSADAHEVSECIQVVYGMRLAEASEWLLELLRTVQDPGYRGRVLTVLAALGSREGERLFRETLQDQRATSELRRIAAQCVLRSGDREGLRVLARLAGDLEPAAVQGLLIQVEVGSQLFTDELVPALGSILRRGAGETTRRAALLALRLAGSREQVLPQLVAAYRSEASGKLLEEIGRALVEVGYR